MPVVVTDEDDVKKPLESHRTLAIAGTCRSWRRIILNIPNLWNNIFLDFRGSKPVKLLEYAKLWISRSENTLITIRNSTSRYTENRMMRENVDPITFLVAPYAARCREIDLRFLESSIDEFFTLPTGSIERLEVLYLETLGFTMPFSHTPDQPLHFIATYIPPLAVHTILRQSRSLLECSFSIIQLDDATAMELNALPQTILPTLKSLMVEFSPQATSSSRPLEAGFLPQCPWSQRAYTGLLARSRFTLRRLAILHYTISPFDLESILIGMPSLADFHLYLWDAEPTEWDRDILAGLASGALLPKLGGAHLLAALEERVRMQQFGGRTREGMARLKALNMSMSGRSDVSPQEMTRFMLLEAEGGPRCRAFIHTRVVCA
ncbi:hypothetical protein R3P38DRAFT_3316640 [Favolaschia claudopus]|uniref:F-box domain-containing protein n=1 Tax=Favolaschia claudopus TaxID=2862362 RepID=A0AAW0BIF3_9AGAR